MRDDAHTRLWRFRHVATRYLNPLTRTFAGWMPGFAILTHRGRTSGRTYRTPINVWRRGDRYVFFLTYGPDVQWVKNVMASGTASIHTRGHDIRLVEPQLIHDPRRHLAPAPIRAVGRLIQATWFVRMRVA